MWSQKEMYKKIKRENTFNHNGYMIPSINLSF